MSTAKRNWSLLCLRSTQVFLMIMLAVEATRAFHH